MSSSIAAQSALRKSEGLPYEAWYKILDALVQRRITFGLSDLEDHPFRVWYDDDLSAREAMDEVLNGV